MKREIRFRGKRIDNGRISFSRMVEILNEMVSEAEKPNTDELKRAILQYFGMTIRNAQP